MRDILDAIEANEAEMQQEAYRFCADVRTMAAFYFDGQSDEDAYIEVRLQILDDGSYHFHSGDACFDLHHHGYWSSGTLSPTDGELDLIDTARSLVAGAIEAAASDLE